VTPCSGTTVPIGGVKTVLFTEDPLEKGVPLSHNRTTFLAIDSSDGATDNVNVHITGGLGFIYMCTPGAQGRFSLFYGASKPFDANFLDAGSLRLAFGNFSGLSIPM